MQLFACADMREGLHVKAPLLLFDGNQNWNFPANVIKSVKFLEKAQKLSRDVYADKARSR
jgi:hypothetical protein